MTQEGSMVAETVRVVCGANRREVSLERDFTARDLRECLANDLSIAKDAKTLVNGKQVPSSYRIQPGDQVEFVKQVGLKG